MTDPTPQAEPRTVAGRALLALLIEEGAPSGAVPVLTLDILAIEAEAAAPAEGLPHRPDSFDDVWYPHTGPAEGLREAAQEMSDALDAPGPSDPIDGEPLTREEVNEAWERHGLRVDVARDALRAALTPEDDR